MNAFAMSTPGHVNPGLWRHPDNRSQDHTDIEYWTSLAKTSEAGKFHGLFLADMLGIYDFYKGPDNIIQVLAGGAQFPHTDPLFSTLDHLSKGRVGWNIVTSYLESAARNFGLDTQIPHNERYEIASEYLDVVYKLWEESWRDDAIVNDPIRRQFTDPERVRRIDHHGKKFSVAGPFSVQPSPQRTPFIFQAGTSTAGKKFAAKHAEAMFIPGMEPHIVRKSVDDIRALVSEEGRDPQNIKLLLGMLVIVDETDELAQAKYEEYLSNSDQEGSLALFGGWTGADLDKYTDDEDFAFSGPGAIQSIIDSWSATIPGGKGIKWTKTRIAKELALGGPHPKAIGSPETVADLLEHWVEVGDVDGFNLSYAVSPGGFEDMIKWLFPELKKRQVFGADYAIPQGTTREQYLTDGKGSRLR
ncbi:alkanesulfonate monooxygenase [Tothia fuscella]|uniref:Alkanesulfonate monooxygenase n=1 Tax=Tothia fuscella TaxID=1048955 RepID=A0A9P4TY57_9PEZI|nr:alkanesulfonate monooxygenase [Tothia fuscella]